MINKDGKEYPTKGEINIGGEVEHLMVLNPPQYINGFLVKHVLVSPKRNPQPYVSKSSEVSPS